MDGRRRTWNSRIIRCADARRSDQYLGDATFDAIGKRRWNRRVKKAIGFIHTLTNCDMLYIGGGNSRQIRFDLPPFVRIVSNEAGITGGIKLWDARLDDLYTLA